MNEPRVVLAEAPADQAALTLANPGRRRWWRGYFLVTLLVVVAYVFLPRGIGSDLVYVAIGCSAVVAIVVGVRTFRPPRAGGWYLMAFGQALWVIGDGVSSYIADVLGEDRFPTVADPIYLSAYPVLAASFVWLMWRGRGRRDPAGLLDAAVVVLGLGLLAFVLLAAPALEQYENSALDAAVAVAYPAGDILLVAVLVAVLTTPGGRSRSTRLLLIAIVLQVVADTLSTGFGLLTFSNTRILDPLWLISFACWGTAALHPSMVALSDPVVPTDARIRRGRFIALVLAVMIAPAILAVQQVLGLRPAIWPVVIGSVGLFGLVMARMQVAIRGMVRAEGQREQLEADLAYQASHDPLTDLPNRSRFRRAMRRALARSGRGTERVGLVLLDLDDFKSFNDSHGYEVGDEVLRVVAERLRTQQPGADLVSRLDGDTFAVLLEPLEQPEQLGEIAQSLADVAGEPVPVSGGRQATISFSVGAVADGPAAIDQEDFQHSADLALARAQSRGRGQVEVVDDLLRNELAVQSTIGREVSAALINDDLELRFEPTLELLSEEIQWFAATTWWQRGAALVAMRDVDLPADRPDLLCDLDGWAIREAVRRLFAWRERPDIGISLEISGERLRRPGLGAEAARALGGRVENRRLAFKFDVSALGADPVIKVNLQDLRTLGIGLAVSGFGTRHSLDSRLASLPLDAAIIDVSAVSSRQGPAAGRELAVLAETARAFGLRTSAEGVRTAADLRLVERLGFTAARGPAVAPEMGALEATGSLYRAWTSPL